MIGETNVNGGAGFNNQKALLKIKAWTGSTIIVSKDSYSKQIKDCIVLDDEYSYWYFETNDYGTWTVTATYDTYTTSETVIVSVVRQYDIILRYILWLFNNGDQCTAVTGGWKSLSGGNAKILDDSIELTGGSQAGHISAVTNSKVNPDGRTVLKVKFVPANSVSSGTGYKLHAGLSSANTAVGTSGMVVNYAWDYSGKYNTEVIYTIDISNYKNSDYYIKFDILQEKATIYEVWMEW